jgi:hypothetical protein
MVYARDRITNFLKQLESVVEQLVGTPAVPVSRVNLVTDDSKVRW